MEIFAPPFLLLYLIWKSMINTLAKNWINQALKNAAFLQRFAIDFECFCLSRAKVIFIIYLLFFGEADLLDREWLCSFDFLFFFNTYKICPAKI